MGKIALVNATSFTTLYAFWLNMEQNFEKKKVIQEVQCKSLRCRGFECRM